ncbi:protein FAM221B-like [Dendronephthya gigantea]|uniref:protein FAM221B-like n=1 Tax=Dendronephthya gigantea TaxID=151771 RepID=UPI00106A1679|nr:protein FAM221B-like [Dendronephthya gigantea]
MARRFSEENLGSSGLDLKQSSSRVSTLNPSGTRGKPTTRFSRYDTSSETKVGKKKPMTANRNSASTTARKQPVTGVNQTANNKQKTTSSSNALVPRKAAILAPKGYTARPIVPASKAELLPVARAMNREDFAPRLKKLFDPEREAALEAIETGVYIGWRCPEFKHDCIRVGKASKCFCGHLLSEHSHYHGNSVKVPCRVGSCACKAFAFVPARPEEVGEWWLPRRPGFDPSTWRAKCKCKHTHEEHSPINSRCQIKTCPCAGFNSAFLCCACDKHWEQHVTVFESASHRDAEGIPYGQHYLPFHEMPELRNVVLTGREDNSSMYEELASGPYAIPENRPSKLALQLRGNSSKKYP